METKLYSEAKQNFSLPSMMWFDNSIKPV